MKCVYVTWPQDKQAMNTYDEPGYPKNISFAVCLWLFASCCAPDEGLACRLCSTLLVALVVGKQNENTLGPVHVYGIMLGN